MSEIRIALIAEGSLDRIVIEAALKAIVPGPFLLTLLQPEATRPRMGTGWSGVVKWCHATSLRHHGSLDADPILADFDVLIIHLDADVADMQYGDCGADITDFARRFNWQVLPCSMPCPPSAPTCDQLRYTVASWLGNATPGRKTVLCIPSKSAGTWLAAAALPATHPLLVNAECDLELENRLSRLPLAERIKKDQRDYRRHAARITNNWVQVSDLCAQARHFEQGVRRVVAPE